MSQQDFDSYENESDHNGDHSLYTRFPVSKLPGKGAVLVLFGSGSLLAGLGLLQSFYLSGAIGESGAISGLARRFGEIGWNPGVLTIGSLVVVGLGSIARSLFNTGRNLLSEIVDLPDASNTLEELDVQHQKLHVNMVNVQGSVERAIQTSFTSLREQMLGIEGRIYNVESTMGSGTDHAAEAEKRDQMLANFAAKMDSFSGRIEAKIDQRLELFEQGLGEELAEVSSSLAETLMGKIRDAEAERRAEQEQARAAREVANRARREAESRTASMPPVLPVLDSLDSLGVFDALDDEGRLVQPPPAPAAGPRPGTQEYLQQQFAQGQQGSPAGQGHPQAPTPAPAPQYQPPGTHMEASAPMHPSPAPQSPMAQSPMAQPPISQSPMAQSPAAPAGSPHPSPMQGGQPQANHQGPGTQYQQPTAQGPAPSSAAHPAEAAQQPFANPTPTPHQAPPAPSAGAHSAATQAPPGTQTLGLDETAIQPRELNLVEPTAEQPPAPLPQRPPAQDERRLQAFDPYDDFSSPMDPSNDPPQD